MTWISFQFFPIFERPGMTETTSENGNITLMPSDGTVQVINAGEPVMIPKEWTGIWDTGDIPKSG